jgi:hypothetical protein
LVLKTFEISLDINSSTIRKTNIELVSNDTSVYVFHISMYNGSTLLDLTTACSTSSISFLKVDSNVVVGAPTITGTGTINYSLGTNEIAFPGKVKTTVELFGGTGSRISSNQFEFNVRDDIGTGIASTTDYPILTDMITDLTALVSGLNPTCVVITNVSGVITSLVTGASSQYITMSTGATSIQWADSPQSLFTARGDILYATGANSLGKLALATSAGYTLEINPTATGIQWGNTELTRSQGFFLDKEYYYNHNIIPFSDCESSDGWANNRWDGVVGTVANDSTNYKTGSQGIGITVSVSGGGGHLEYVKNLAVFPDGLASATTDYIRICIYIATAEINKMAADSNLTLVFHCDTIPTFTNYFYYQGITKASLSNGWNYFNIAKSAFGTGGSPDWANVKGLSVYYDSTGGTAPTSAMTWTIDSIHLCRKNPSSSAPNLFVKKINNTETAEFAINSGFWWLGLENGILNLRNLNPSTAGGGSTAAALVGIVGYSSNFIAKMKLTIKTANYSNRMVWEIDASNRIALNIYNSVLYLWTTVAGIDDTTISTAYTCAIGDTVEFVLKRETTTVSLMVYKNGNYNSGIALTKEVSFASVGYLAVGDVDAIYQNIESLSITTTSHASYADVAEVAKSLTNAWQNWVPTLTWTTADPASVTTVARYAIIGNTCFFNFMTTSADGNAATQLSISLPIAAKDNNSIIAFSGYQLVNTTYSNPICYLDDDSGGITFRSFSTATDAQTVTVVVSGQYEIA